MGVAKLPAKQLGDAGLWKSISGVTIATTVTQIIDTADISEFDTIEYTFKATMAVGDQVRYFKVGVARQSSGVVEVIYGRIGNVIDMDVVTEVLGSTYNIKVTNNELTDLVLTGAKLIL